MSLCLTSDELQEFTGRVRPSYQARELGRLGIPYRRRSDGTLIVLRIHIEVAESREPQLRLGGR